jgi:hypothetical protein
MISGRGSGAAHYSQTHFTTVTNIDIGGGSANSATFRSGALVATAAMNYGGRILEIDAATGRVRALAAPARRILADCGLRLEAGDAVTLDALRHFTDRMADLTVELIEGTASSLAQQLYLTPPAPVSGRGTVLMFSGGIGHDYYTPGAGHHCGGSSNSRRRWPAAGGRASPPAGAGGLSHRSASGNDAGDGAGRGHADGDALWLYDLGRARDTAAAQRAGRAASDAAAVGTPDSSRRHQRCGDALGHRSPHRRLCGRA